MLTKGEDENYEVVKKVMFDDPVQVEETNEYIFTITAEQIAEIENEMDSDEAFIYFGLFENKEGLSLDDRSAANWIMGYSIEDPMVEFDGIGDSQMLVGWDDWKNADGNCRIYSSDYPDGAEFSGRITNVVAYATDADGYRTDSIDNRTLRINDRTEEDNCWQLVARNSGRVYLEFSITLENSEEYTVGAYYDVSKCFDSADFTTGSVETFAQGSEFTVNGSLTRHEYRKEDLVYPRNWDRDLVFDWEVTNGSEFVDITPDDTDCRISIKDDIFEDNQDNWEERWFNIKLSVYEANSKGEAVGDAIAVQERGFRIAETYTEYSIEFNDLTMDSFDEMIDSGKLTIPLKLIRYDQDNPGGVVLSSASDRQDINQQIEVWDQCLGNYNCELIDTEDKSWNGAKLVLGLDSEQFDGSDSDYPYTCRLRLRMNREDNGNGDYGFDVEKEIRVVVCEHIWKCIGSCSEAHKLNCEYCGTTIDAEAGEHNFKEVLKIKAALVDGVKVLKCTECGELDVVRIPKSSEMTISQTSAVYNGSAFAPTVVVKDVDGNVIDASQYEVSYGAGEMTNVGKHKVVVTFNEDSDYSNSLSKDFTINPKGTTLGTITAASGALTVKWTKQATQTTGYELQYGTSSSFSGAKTATITSTSTVSKKITKLSKKKTYYLRIRTYKTVNGVKYYSAWSSKKSAKTK